MTGKSVCALLLISGALFAQDFRATLTGTVTDSTGAVIPDATVKATNVANNAVKEVKTTSEGAFTIPYLDPGTYNVEVMASGFQALKRTALVLQVAQKMNLPVQMTVGQATTEITITGQQETIDTADASRGLVFDPLKVSEYPLNGRQTYMLMALTPGVIFGQEQFGASGFSGTRGWDVNNSYKINGARQGGNLFLLNGAPISSDNGSWRLAPNVEAVQEFKVMTNTYDASFGDFRGGAVNTTIKSGSNSWRGNVYEFYRTTILDANSFQSNRTGQPRLFHNQHQFGGVYGGPVRKDKDFVFLSFEGWQEKVPFPINVTTPPMALRDGQHFTDYGMTIFDPLTTHPCTPGSGAASTEPCSGSFGSAFWRNQFPGNVIPQSRISPIGAKILSYYPKETVPGVLLQNYVSGNTGRYWYNQPMVRFDHNFGVNDKFYAMFSEQDGYEYRANFPKPAAAPGNTDNKRTFTNVILNYTRVLSAASVFDIRASYYRFTQTSPGYNDEALKLTATKDFGMTQMVNPPTSKGDIVPGFSLPQTGTTGGYGAVFGNGSPLGTWAPETTFNLAPSFNLTRGSHNLRLGFDYKYRIAVGGATGNSEGNFTFTSELTRQASGRSLTNTDQFNGIATVLLGIPTNGSIAYNDTNYRTRPSYGFYAQDDWKLTSRVTINLGLRYDISMAYLERFNRGTSTFDPYAVHPLNDRILAAWRASKAAYDATNPRYPYPAVPAAITGRWLFAGVDGQPRRAFDTDYSALAPRIGLAWRIREKTVLRTGFGVFYENLDRNQNQNGYSQSTDYVGSLDGQYPSACAGPNTCLTGPPTGPYSLVNPFPNGFAIPPGASAGPMVALGNSVSYVPRHYKVPRTYQYSFGFQHQLPKGMVVDLSFSGNKQIYGTFDFDMNWPEGAAGLALQNQGIADASFYNTQLPNPFYGILPANSGTGQSTTRSRQQLMQTFAMWGGMSSNIQGAKYRSEELQLKVEKKVGGENSTGGAFTWIVAWTFGKEYEQNHRITAGWDTTQPLYYEPSNQDKTHSFSFNGVYDLPFGKGRHFANSARGILNHAIGGWRADWILNYVSGYPIGMPNLINFCGEWKAKEQNENSWFNNDPKCFADQPSNTLRTMPDRFASIREHQKPQLNAALTKDFQISERIRLNLRGEGFNITNTPIRTNPSTTRTSADFGKLGFSQKNFPRFFQLAGKVYF
jgi:hypothetical protein